MRRLKEIAEASRDHASSLRFAADENRATRWISKRWLASLLDLTFSATSNYGQSVARPAVWLALTLSLVLSATHGLAFLPAGKETATAASGRLFPGGVPRLVGSLALTQNLLSFIFLFLIGLGLRNRFRL